jgi:hypothetical protein
MLPPGGEMPNFTDPPSLHRWTLGVGITSMVLMTLAVTVRIYTKAVVVRDVRHEDYVAIFSLAGFLTYGVMYIYLSSLGMTRDLWNIRAIDVPYMLYMTNIFQLVYPVAMGAAKYFICVQLKRIFCPPHSMRSAVWWLLQGLIATTIMYYIACFFTFLFQCVPREKIWNPMLDGKCIDGTGGMLSAGLINLILDLGLLIVPCWAIWHLQMPMKRKLGAISIFSVGIFTCAIAAAGVAYRIPLLREQNQTRAAAYVGLWTYAEIVGTLVVGCMPMFPRFYEHSRIIQGPLSGLRSIKSFISSSTTSTSRGTKGSKSLQVSSETTPSKSEEKIVITSHFIRNEGHQDDEYIELRDSYTTKPNWRAFDAV